MSAYLIIGSILAALSVFVLLFNELRQVRKWIINHKNIISMEAYSYFNVSPFIKSEQTLARAAQRG